MADYGTWRPIFGSVLSRLKVSENSALVWRYLEMIAGCLLVVAGMIAVAGGDSGQATHYATHTDIYASPADIARLKDFAIMQESRTGESVEQQREMEALTRMMKAELLQSKFKIVEAASGNRAKRGYIYIGFWASEGGPHSTYLFRVSVVGSARPAGARRDTFMPFWQYTTFAKDSPSGSLDLELRQAARQLAALRASGLTSSP